MLNMLLFVDLMTRLSMPNVIVGIVLSVVGISFAFLSKRIARAVRKNHDISENDNVYVALKVIGLILIVAGLLFTVVK